MPECPGRAEGNVPSPVRQLANTLEGEGWGEGCSGGVLAAGICHSERSKESRQVEMKKTLRGVYPEQKLKRTLRFAQGDTWNACCREYNTNGVL